MTKQPTTSSSGPSPLGDGAPVSDALAFADANNAFDEIDKLNQRFSDRLTLGNLILAERYVRGDLKILVEARWASVDFNLVFQRKHPDEIIGGSPSDHKRLSPGDRTADYGACSIRKREKHGHDNFGSDLNDCQSYDYDGVMLVDNIEHMQRPECIVNSLATFQPKEKPLGSGIDALYFGYTSGFKSFGFPLDWKPAVTVWHSFSSTDAVTDQIVEHASEIVNGIPDDRACLSWDGFIEKNAINILSGARILLSNKTIRLALVEGLYDRLELLNVAFGPFNF